MLKIFILSLLVLATLAQGQNLQQDFAGGPVTLTCTSTEQEFTAETKRRLDVYTSRASFCRAQTGATVAIIDRCVRDAYEEWRRLEKQVEDLIVACDARNPDAPRTCATKVAEYADATQMWRDSRTVQLTQCYALQDKEKRQLCVDLCVERFELTRPLRPVCDTKEGQSCQTEEAAYKSADAAWQADSQKALDACEGKKDKDECVDRAVVFWTPRKPVAPACSREAVCDREVREYRKQERNLRVQRVEAMAACDSSKTPAGVAACQSEVISHYQNQAELLKKPKCHTNLAAPDVRNEAKCPAATTWECKALVCRDTASKAIVSSRCCDQTARNNCARELLASKKCDKLPTRADRDRCRQEQRREATEITQKKACPSVESFELRLKTLREQRDRDASKCKKADAKCTKDVEDRFLQQEKQVTHDPCFRKSNRCDEDVREYRRAVQALKDERKAAILLCKDQACREDTRARFTLKRVQLERPVCDGAEIHLDVSCGREKTRFAREHDELERQRVSGLAKCRALPNLEERRKCQDDLIKESERRRSLIRKPVCKENAREFTCRTRISEYTRQLERFRAERSAALAACKGDAKCEEPVIAQFATKRKSLTRPDCAKTPQRSDDKCIQSQQQHAKRLREHEKKLQTALAACKQSDCREKTTKAFAEQRKAIKLPECKPRVSTELRELRNCDTLKTREARQICRNVVLDTRVAAPNPQQRRLEAMGACRRFTHRTRRAACEQAVRVRFPGTEHDFKLANDLKQCKKSAQFHQCREEALKAALALCKNRECRDRERREARRFLTADYRERVALCGKDLECARKEDDAFFARVHQESSDVRRLRCEAITDADRKAECLEAVRHRHRLVLTVRQCGKDDKCVRAARMQACSEYGDADVKQRCVDRRVTADRLHEARAACRVKHARSEPARRACLVEARRAFPAIRRSCDGRIGKELLRCHRRNAREMRHAAVRRQKRSLKRCKNAACRSRAVADLLETRALYRRFSQTIRTCSTPQALLKEATSEKCAADAVKDFELRKAAMRFVRRCDRINNKAGRIQCRAASHTDLTKRHCKAEDKACAARLGVLLQLAKEQHDVRVQHSDKRQVCNKLTNAAAREECLKLATRDARSDNRVERAKRACLEIKDTAASDACIRRAIGGPDVVPVRVAANSASASSFRSSSTSGFPLWAIGPIAFGLIVIAVVVVVIIAYRRARARRPSPLSVDSV